MLESLGLIRDLQRQVPFPLAVNGIEVCRYVADFVYLEAADARQVVEDVKSEHTRELPVYRLKKKLMRAVHGIEINEV